MQAKDPAAFLSYDHRDDQYGDITRLRERLEHAVGVALGKDFEIFQDRHSIRWGQHWPDQLDEALERAVFLIPILSPSFFESRHCRAELEKFLELERRAGRKDLILPLYFRTARSLEDESDPLAAALSERQHRNWRDVRHKPIDSPEVIQRLDQLADEIEAAIRRPAPAGEAGRRASPPEGIAEGPPVHPPAAEPPPDLEPIEEERRVVRNVALRAAPALGADAVTRLKAGAVVYVAGRARDSGWFRIEGDGDLRGYVVADAVVSLEPPTPNGQPGPPEHGEPPKQSEPAAPAGPKPTTPTMGPTLEPGTVFRDVDAPWCPELVVIPAGRFLMGSSESEEGRWSDEGPQHKVRIAAPFALGRYPVMFEEYDAFCAATGRKKPGDEGWGRGRQPVINVSWKDAQAYVAWLRERTGQPYRLPSEAEWEYACRAGTTTRYWWGDAITPQDANYGRNVGQTTEVGRYRVNPWNLHDMPGNVHEWIEDRRHESYEGAPSDGSAWLEGTESLRVVRGGSWNNGPSDCRAAYRYKFLPNTRHYSLGFRVARMLTP